MKTSRHFFWGLLLLSATSLLIWFFYSSRSKVSVADFLTASSPSPNYVGAQTCAHCHEKQFAAWRGSHHELAMQPAKAKEVLGDFKGVKFNNKGVTTSFFKRDEKFYINTDGPDGKMQDFEVKYTFGVDPLQQYLVELPGGWLQAFSVAWDARPKAEGGQKWFHLYPKEKINYTDELHWTKLSQNWNHMCAECHSTNLKKNYDLASNQFKTTWSDISVSCESCHGPGSRHVEWSKAGKNTDLTKGLVHLLDENNNAHWIRSENSKTAIRTPELQTVKEINTCARCHARRSTLTEDYRHGKPLLDSHLPSLLTLPSYHPDGQIKEEDFEYGSFAQSKMFHKGVTCSNCHEPHSLKLRAPGNLICLQCHSPQDYNTSKHHFHKPEGLGASCIECHMPASNFMVIHARHDHSLRIPRPDLSIMLKTPNACNKCHSEKTPDWAQEKMRKWYGNEWEKSWHFGKTLFRAQQEMDPRIGQDVLAIATAPKLAEIVRATAVSLLPNYFDQTAAAVLPTLLKDVSPLIRREALGLVGFLPSEQRWGLAGNLLSDETLAVRIEAARVLASSVRNQLSTAQQSLLDKAVKEYIGVEMTSAEHPQSHVNLAILYTGLGESQKSIDAYFQALKLDPTYVRAYVNLADLYRELQQDSKGEELLLKAIKHVGENGDIEHALGLYYIRSQQVSKALLSLEKAARLLPENSSYGYVYGVALYENGESEKSFKVLKRVHVDHPYDRDVLTALMTYAKVSGQLRAAKEYAAKLVKIDPRYGSAEELLQQLPSKR